MSKLDELRADLLASMGSQYAALSTPELWLIYLAAYPGSLLDRQAQAASARGQSLPEYIQTPFSEQLGPELATLAYGQYSFSGTGAPTGDANGIHWNGSNSLATALHAAVTEDNAEYEITYEVFNYTAGGVRVVLGGATTAHGFTGTTRTANGIYTERGTTNNAGSSIQDQFRFQSTVTTTTLSVRNISVRRVL